MLFYVGLHQVSDAKHFERSFISVNRLMGRKSDFIVDDWIMDSGAFSRINTKGEHLKISEYAERINRFSSCGNLVAAVTQDYLCEPLILKKTGFTILKHQKLTLERYLDLRSETEVYVMPVLQGYAPEQYMEHVEMYGADLEEGAYVGVGSVCRRNTRPLEVLEVFAAIKKKRPDLRLHGFGLKHTALEDAALRKLLYSSDSMAWSFAARYEGRNQNDWREAKAYELKIQKLIQ